MVFSSLSNSEMELQNVNSDQIYQSKQPQPQFITTGNLHLHYHQQQLEYYMETCPLDLSDIYGFLDPFPPAYDPLDISFQPQNQTIHYDDFSSSYQCPKRQKLVPSPYSSDFVSGFVNDNPNSNVGVHMEGKPVETTQKMGNENSKCVSMQSIAARERRRKITEKTQELAKLVPGGNKMNTAEMLQAAFKYVKFLQAQLGILQFMDSFQENEKVVDEENMQIVTSSKVQEKLYMEDKCLVPKNVVLSLASLSKSPFSDELSQLFAFAPHPMNE